MIILSFDVSSTTTGWSVFNLDKNNKITLTKYGYIKPKKKGDIFERLLSFRKDIESLLNKYKPDSVAIEDIVQFMPRNSSANTIITLALYNRIVGLTVLDTLKMSPHLYSVMAIRHGIKIENTLPKKEDIPTLVETILGIKLNVEHTRTGSIRMELYDQADSIACGLHHANQLLKNKSDTRIKKNKK